jgi:predicted DNA-binding protein (UPF0251 family)
VPNTAVEIPVLEGWLTASQAAEILGVTRQAVNQKIRAGLFKTAGVVGGDNPVYLIKEREVEKVADERL